MNYLQDYLEVLPLVTKQVQHDFDQISLLDSYSQDRSLSIKDEEKVKLLSKLEYTFTDACVLSKEKIAIASSCYEYIDKQVRRLDGDLQKFEIALAKFQMSKDPLEQREHTFRNGDKIGLAFSSIDGAPAPSLYTVLNSSSSRMSRKKLKAPSSKNKKPKSGPDAEDVDALGSDDAPDLSFQEYPIDPNEPTYCFCKQVSFGEMICCDNEDCDIKWFHFDCIDMKTLPKGTWFCSECALRRKKEKKQI